MVTRKTDGIVISAGPIYIPLWGKAGNFPNMEQIPALLGVINSLHEPPHKVPELLGSTELTAGNRIRDLPHRDSQQISREI